MYYNVYVAESVTRQGRSYISCSIMLFESLLANNVKFNNLDEVITFIHNVVNEKPKRKYDDSLILDRNITVEETFFKICTTVDMTLWIPTDKQLSLIWDYLITLSQEDINRLYYKNNIYMFCDNKVLSDLLIKILCLLDEPFMNPNKPPKCINNELNILVDLIKEYVYYAHFYIDKLDRIEYMQRDIVAICDTDSTIISFDAWYRFLLEKTYKVPMKLKQRKYNIVDLVMKDKYELREMVDYVDEEPVYDYNFYTDEVMEIQRSINMCEIIPQDNLKYSIINIIAYICSELIIDYLNEYTKLTGSYQEGVKCRMVMKNNVI